MLDKEEILKQYMQWVDDVSDALENKTHFTPEEIVYKICEIIEEEFGLK